MKLGNVVEKVKPARVPLRIKIVGMALLVLVIGMSSSVYSILVNNKLEESVHQLGFHTYTSANIISELEVQLVVVNSMLISTKYSDPDVSGIKDNLEKLQTYINEYSSFDWDGNGSDSVSSASMDFNLWKTYVELSNEALAILQSGGELSIEMLSSLESSYDSAFSELINKKKLNEQNAVSVINDATLEVSKGFRATLMLSLTSLVVGVLSASLLSRAIVKPILKLSSQVSRIARGDLTTDGVHIVTNDEISQLARHFYEMRGSLRRTLQTIDLHANTVAATSAHLAMSSSQTTQAAEQIAISVVELAEGADSQLSEVEISSQTMEHVSSSTDSIIERFEAIAYLSSVAESKATLGQGIVVDAATLIKEGHVQMHSTTNEVSQLKTLLVKIGDIISIINNIASQTHLLSLNASIEAARAGEHGRGFSVVASEVGKLAKQSNEASIEIENLITAVQNKASSVMEAMGTVSSSLDNGVLQVLESSQSFSSILESINAVVDEISSSAEQIENVSSGVKDMMSCIRLIEHTAKVYTDSSQGLAAVAEQTTASMQEVSSDTYTLSEMSKEMLEIVSKFKLA